MNFSSKFVATLPLELRGWVYDYLIPDSAHGDYDFWQLLPTEL